MSSISPSSGKMGRPVRGRTQSQKRRAEKRSPSPTSVTESPNGDAVKRIRTNGSIANASAQNTNQNTIICSLSHNELKKDPEGKVNNIDGIQFIDHGDWIQIKEVGLRKNYLKLWVIKCYGDKKPPTYAHNQSKITNGVLTYLGCPTKEEYNQNKEVYNLLLKVYENIDNPEKLGEIILKETLKVPILTIINWLIEYEIKDLEKVKITKENNGLTLKKSLMCFASEKNNVEAIKALNAAGVKIANDPGVEIYNENGIIRVTWSTLAHAVRSNQLNAIVALKAAGVKITNDPGVENYDENGNIRSKLSSLAVAAKFNQVNAIMALKVMGVDITNDPGLEIYDENGNIRSKSSSLAIAANNNNVKAINALKAIGVDIINDPGVEFYDEKGNIKETWSTLAVAARNNQVDTINALKVIDVDITNDRGHREYDENNNEIKVTSALEISKAENHDSLIELLTSLN